MAQLRTVSISAAATPNGATSDHANPGASPYGRPNGPRPGGNRPNGPRGPRPNGPRPGGNRGPGGHRGGNR